MTIKDVERKFISIGEASVFTGMSQETLRRYFKQGKVNGFTSAGGQRRFEVESLKQLCSANMQANQRNEMGVEQTEQRARKEKRNIIYARVSSKKQADDLERQIQFIKEEITKQGKSIDDFELISDIGSGINFNKKGTNILLDYALSRTIGEVIVANRDRLSRFGFDLFKAIIIKSGGKLTVINDVQSKSSEQELAEDLLSIVHIFSCKQMGKRSYKNRKCSNQDSKVQDSPGLRTEGYD